MSYTYATYTAALAELMVTPSTDPNFVAIEPSIIDYAEQRIYRELDLLGTNITDSTATLTADTRNFTLPSGQGTFIVVDYINVLTPVGSTAADGTRTPLIPMSRDTIDVIYPSGQTATGVPQYFGMINPGTVMLAPSPDATYATEVIGTIRPTPLLTNAVSGITGSSVGSTSTAESTTLSIAQMPAHNHGGVTGNPTTNPTLAAAPVPTAIAGNTGTTFYPPSGPTSPTLPNHVHTISSQGGGTAHTNVQPTAIAGLTFIKT